MRYMLSVLIIIFTAGCAETDGQARNLLLEAYNQDLQRIRALRPEAKDVLPEKLTTQDGALIAHFLIYYDRVSSEYR